MTLARLASRQEEEAIFWDAVAWGLCILAEMEGHRVQAAQENRPGLGAQEAQTGLEAQEVQKTMKGQEVRADPEVPLDLDFLHILDKV